jgi:hypothetical protein
MPPAGYGKCEGVRLVRPKTTEEVLNVIKTSKHVRAIGTGINWSSVFLCPGNDDSAASMAMTELDALQPM